MSKIIAFPGHDFDDDDGDDGEGGGSGRARIRTPEEHNAFLTDLLAVFDEERLTRLGLSQSDLSLVRELQGSGQGQALKSHKILKSKKQFSGIAKDIAANPAANELAQKQDAQRLQNAYRKRLGLSHTHIHSPSKSL